MHEIRYSQCWEDADLVTAILDIKADDVVVAIASGGCNVLAISATGCQRVHAVDQNPAQVALVDLKMVAAAHLGHEDYLRFLGVKSCSSRWRVFLDLIPFLREETVAYFLEHKKIIKRGCIHGGKFERYIALFRKWVLPIVQKKSTINALLTANSKEQQAAIYHSRWNNARWRFLGAIFFGQRVMQSLGRHKSMFRYHEGNRAGKVYLQRAGHALEKGEVLHNPYLSYILRGHHGEVLPRYAREAIFLAYRDKKNISLVCSGITGYLKDMPGNSVSRFALSDVFECLGSDESDALFGEIYRVAKPGARLLFWNNLVHRDVPEGSRHGFAREEYLESRFKNQEKVFFYDQFYLYTIRK